MKKSGLLTLHAVVSIKLGLLLKGNVAFDDDIEPEGYNYNQLQHVVGVTQELGASPL